MPPLEDMSELVEQAKQLQQQREKETTTSKNSADNTLGNTPSVKGPDQGSKGNESLSEKDTTEKGQKKVNIHVRVPNTREINWNTVNSA